MRRSSERQKRKTTHYSAWIMRVAAVLGCLTLISVYLLSGAYSRFYTSASGADSARVAHFSPKFPSAEIITVENQLPGFPDVTDNSYVIDFTVQNTSDENPSEVAMKYKIILKTTGNIPLKFTVCKSDGSNSKEFNCNGTSGEQKYYYTNDTLVFGVGTKETDSYKLKIEWSSDKKDAEFSGMTDAVYLEAVFEQID